MKFNSDYFKNVKDYASIKNYEFLNKKKGRELKIKQPNYNILLENNTFKKKKAKTPLEKILSKDLKTDEEITRELQILGEPITKETISNFRVVKNLSSFLKKYTISQNIINKPIYFPVLCTKKLELSKFTSDYLYWGYMLSENSVGYRKYLTKNIHKVKIFTIDVAEIKKEIDIEEYYLNDNDVDISAPFLYNQFQQLKEEEFKDGNKFNIGRNYYLRYYRNKVKNDDNILLIKDGTKLDLKVLKKATQIYNNEFFFKKGVKPIKKKDGLYFFEKEFRPTNFCPFICDFKDINFQVGFVCEIEMDVDELYSNITMYNNLDNIPDYFVTWNNIKEVMQLFEIICLYSDDNNLKTYCYKFIRFWNLNTSLCSVITKHCKTIYGIILDYLDSFVSKINVQKIYDLQKKVSKFLLEEKAINNIKLKFLEEGLDLVQGNYKIFDLIKNTFKSKVIDTIYLMKTTLDQIINLSAPIGSLEANIRSTGYALYDLLLTGNLPVVPTTKSISGFLSNLTGELTEDVIKENINSFYKAVSKVKEIENNYFNVFETLQKKLDLNNKLNFLNEFNEIAKQSNDNNIKNFFLDESFNVLHELNEEIGNKSNVRNNYYDEAKKNQINRQNEFKKPFPIKSKIFNVFNPLKENKKEIKQDDKEDLKEDIKEVEKKEKISNFLNKSYDDSFAQDDMDITLLSRKN